MNVLLIIIIALLFPGVINITRSLLSGRKGPGLLQPLKDLIRIFRKGSVYSHTTGAIFKLAPTISFAAIVCASLVLPIGPWKAALSFEGDFVFFIYMLGLGRFLAIVSAMDTGSSFEGMGASREAHFAMLAEPAFLILLGSLVLFTGHYSFHDIFTTMRNGSAFAYGIGVMSAFLIFLFTLVETCRLPVDDPRTHLELTMVHEVMILDNSGFDLGLFMLTSAMKFAVFGTIIADFFLFEATAWSALLIFVGIQTGLAIMVAFVESFMARFRMTHNPQFILSLTSLAFLIFIGILLFLQK
ncbi:MAG: NADH-quinone oxidoreductase subunit H [Bacteroidota bacterium]